MKIFLIRWKSKGWDREQEKEFTRGHRIQNKKKKAEKRSKRQGEKESYIYLNAEFQRTARRNKKAFLSDQCKEIEEKNRMGKTRDLKKIRDTKGTFHAKMSSIKEMLWT